MSLSTGIFHYVGFASECFSCLLIFWIAAILQGEKVASSSSCMGAVLLDTLGNLLSCFFIKEKNYIQVK